MKKHIIKIPRNVWGHNPGNYNAVIKGVIVRDNVEINGRLVSVGDFTFETSGGGLIYASVILLTDKPMSLFPQLIRALYSSGKEKLDIYKLVGKYCQVVMDCTKKGNGYGYGLASVVGFLPYDPELENEENEEYEESEENEEYEENKERDEDSDYYDED